MRRDHLLVYLPHIMIFSLFLLITGIDTLMRETAAQMLLLICSMIVLIIGMVALLTPLSKHWRKAWWKDAARVGVMVVYGAVGVLVYEALSPILDNIYVPRYFYSLHLLVVLLFIVLLIVGAYWLARLLWAIPKDDENPRPQLSPRREVQILADDGQITTISTKQLRRLRREGKQIVVLDGEPDEAPRQQTK